MYHRISKGFTLVEVLVAMSIFTAVIIGVTSFTIQYLKNTTLSVEEIQQINIVQQAHTRILKELREARIGDDGSWPLVLCNDTDITFFSDTTGDGRSDKIRYFVDGTTLKREVIEPTTVPVSYPAGNETVTILSEYLDLSGGPIFTYYDGNWPQDTVNNPISGTDRLTRSRFIRVTIGINQTENFAAEPYIISSAVSIRSLKNNL